MYANARAPSRVAEFPRQAERLRAVRTFSPDSDTSVDLDRRGARLTHGGLDAAGDGLAGEADLLVEELRGPMRHVGVGEAHAEDSGGEARVGERLPDGRAEPAGEDPLLHRHEEV